MRLPVRAEMETGMGMEYIYGDSGGSFPPCHTIRGHDAIGEGMHG